MKLETDHEGDIVLKEVYNDVVLETEEGNRVYVRMRDDTFELYVKPKDVVGVNYRINMQTRGVEKL